MTLKEMVADYVAWFDGDIEDAVSGTLFGLFVLFIITAGFLLAWKFTLAVLAMIGFVIGLFALFAWATDEL